MRYFIYPIRGVNITVISGIKNKILNSIALKSYFEAICGYFVFKKLVGFKKKKKLLVNPFPGIGDIFLIAKHLPEYLEKENIDDYCFVVCTDSIVAACSMYEDLKIAKISKRNLSSLIRYSFLSDSIGDSIRILHHHIPQDYSSIGYFSQGLNGTTQKDLLINCDLHISANGAINNANYEMCDKELFEIKKKYVLNENTIIIAPYSNSFKCLDDCKQFWPTLVEKMQKKGFVVYSNVNGDEKPIAGTEKISLSIPVMRSVLNCCHAFISSRSGLCDVIACADCICICLYNDQCIVGQNTCFEYYNLKALGLSDDAIELSISPENPIDYVDEIIAYL